MRSKVPPWGEKSMSSLFVCLCVNVKAVCFYSHYIETLPQRQEVASKYNLIIHFFLCETALPGQQSTSTFKVNSH